MVIESASINVSTDYSALYGVVQTHLAIMPDAVRKVDLAETAAGLIEDGEIVNLQDLLQQLSEQPITSMLWQKLIAVASIGETYFFRDQSQMDALRTAVLPSLIEERREAGQLRLRLWSAGCSTGEEPYTLAILLRDLLPDFSAWDISILATDLSNSNLERAKRGFYRPWSFRSETPEALRERWFTAERGMYQIDDSIRDMVKFESLNLAADDYRSVVGESADFDLVLCRNVLIYFDMYSASAVVTRLCDALATCGWLVLGHAETTYGITQKQLIPCNFEHAVLYRKCISSIPCEDVGQPIHVEPMPEPLPVPRPPEIIGRPCVSVLPHGAEPAHKSSEIVKPDPLECAWAAANREDWDEALHWLREASKHHKLRPEVHYLRGMIEMHQGKAEDALVSLRQTIYCDNNFVMAHFLLGEVYECQGLCKQALNHWNQTRSILANCEPDELIPFSNDLTAEMLRGLLEFHLSALSFKG